MFSATTLVLALLTNSFTQALPSAAAVAACSAISAVIPNKNFLPDTAEYNKENKDYYNAGNAELRPACIAMPTSALDVSSIVQTLNRFKDVEFAVKSGGHSPNPGQASVKDGVLIALRNLSGTQLDKEKNVAYVKPGGHWWDVMRTLEGTGRMVVSGRLGTVGIGGFLTQGGVSFLSGQYGLASDNVEEYEMVLPNGTIANINQKQYPDLVTAMRGSGSQFGIVTRFTLKTYALGQWYVGARIYNCTRLEFNDAVQDFIANIAVHPKVATLMPFGGQIYDIRPPPKTPTPAAPKEEDTPGFLDTIGDMADKISNITDKISNITDAISNATDKVSSGIDHLQSIMDVLDALTEGANAFLSKISWKDFLTPSNLASLGSLLGVVGQISGAYPSKPGVTRNPLAPMSPQVQMETVSRAFNGYTHFNDRTAALFEAIRMANLAVVDENQKSLHVMPVLYDGEIMPREAWGKKFNALPVSLEIGAPTKYHSIIGVSDPVWKWWGFRTTFRTATLPVLPEYPQFMGDIEDIFKSVSATYSPRLRGYAGQWLVLQPFPRAFGNASEARGGNAMALKGTDHDRYVLEMPAVYNDKADDKLMTMWNKAFSDAVEARLQVVLGDMKRKGKLREGVDYNPYFMNDAAGDQDVLGSYKENAKFAKLQRMVDPQGLFAVRAGGYKFKQHTM
ncbi:hypothetical protein FKW77_002220 [Venturia effusa]|uniref:FAD-binding PCMH-type domain-containing protein n=1 Tax=Venturia effusa TaxID=50376 RepID=A0A517LBY5_9PEZI|nr:hypothetical protein FKW77_002220 [Venturia effusa]